MNRFACLGAAVALLGVAAGVGCGNAFSSDNGSGGTGGGTAPTAGDDYETPDDQTSSDLEIDPTQENTGGVAYDSDIPVEHRIDQCDNPPDVVPEPPGAGTTLTPGPAEQPYIGDAIGTFNPPLGNAADIVDVLDENNPPPDDAPKVDKNGKPLWHRTVYTVTRNGMKVRCYGSLYNCEMPNDQPGLRRYLPTAVATDIETKLDAITDATKRGEAINTELEDKGHWDVTGSPQMVDGLGVIRGNVTSPNVRLNFGQKKTIGGVLHVYAWSTNITAPNGISYVASGWIPLSSIVSTEVSTKMPAVTAPIPGGNLYTFTQSSKTHNPVYYSLKNAADYGCANGYLPTSCLPTWTQTLDIAPDSRNASNKLYFFFLREGEVENFLFSTPWASTTATDTFGAAPNVIFRRLTPSAHHATLLRIPLFRPGQHKVSGGITFLYGQMNGRWGWVNWFALKTVPAPPDSSCDGRQPGVTYCLPSQPTDAIVCPNETDTVCSPAQHCREADPVTHEAALDPNGKVICDQDQ